MTADEFLDAPSADEFLDAPSNADSFLGDQSADAIRNLVQAPGSDFVPSDAELRTIYADEQGKGIGSPAKAAEAAVGMGRHLLGLGWNAGKEIGKQYLQNPGPTVPLPLLTSAITGAGIGDFALADLARKGYARVRDAISQPEDPFAAWKDRYLNNLAGARTQEDFATGQDLPLPVSQEMAQKAVQSGMVNPTIAEFSSYLPNPASVAGATFQLLGKAPSLARVAQRAAKVPPPLPGKPPPLPKPSLMTQAGSAVKAGGEAVDKVTSLKSPLAKVGTMAGLVGAAGAEGFSGPITAAAGALGAAKAGAKTAVKAGEVLEAAGQTTGKSSLGRIEQITMNEAAPKWIREAGQKLKFLDPAIRQAGAAAKAGVAGGAVMGGLALPGAEDPDEFWQAVGSGVALGSLSHLATAPFVSGQAREAAKAHDLVRWYSRRTPQEQVAIRGWSREDALRSMVGEWLINGVLKDANVPFSYLSTQEFPHQNGIRGVALDLSSGQPRIVINADLAKGRTVLHEIFHVLQQTEAVDNGAMRRLLVDTTDQNGNVVTKGLLSREEFARRADEYVSRFDEQTRKTLADEQAKNPEAFEKRIVDELGAELFANLGEGTAPGELIRDSQSLTRRALDWALTQEQWGVLRKMGEALEKKLGREITGSSDIFSGLKNTPEVNALLRDFIRERQRLTKRLEFDEEAADTTFSMNANEVLVKGNEKLIDRFGNDDHFAKDPRSPRPDKVWMPNNTPIVLSDHAAKVVAQNRVQAQVDALTKVPDTGEPGVVRVQPNGEWTGRVFSDAQIAALEALPDDVFTPAKKAELRRLNDMVKAGDGQALVFWYNPERSGKKKGGNIRETVRVGVPMSWHISLEGNFRLRTLDVTAFHNKLEAWLTKKPAFFADFQAPDATVRDTFVRKVLQYLDNHAKGQHGEIGLDTDGAKALRMKNAIADFINFNTIATDALVPNRQSTSSNRDKLIRDRRLDRINRVEVAASDKMPIDYELIKQNFSPLDDGGKIADDAAMPANAVSDARYSPKKAGRLAPRLAPKMWIAPDLEIIDTKGRWHVDWMHGNAAAVKAKGFDVSKFDRSEDVSGPRLHALNAGWTRIVYDPNTGRLGVEASQAGWGQKLKDRLFVLAAENIGKIDSMSVSVLNKKGQVVDNGFANLFQYSNKERLNRLPLISEEEVGGMSAQRVGGRERFSPGAAPEPAVQPEPATKLVDDILKTHAEFGGSTFNPASGKGLGGEPYYAVSIFPERGLVLDRPVTAEDLQGFLQQNADLFADPDVSLGTWFDSASGKTYVDASVTVPDKDFATFLGQKFNQKAAFDLQKFEEVPTGGTGEFMASGMPEVNRLKASREEYAGLAPRPEPTVPAPEPVPAAAEVVGGTDSGIFRSDDLIKDAPELRPLDLQRAQKGAKASVLKSWYVPFTVDGKVKAEYVLADSAAEARRIADAKVKGYAQESPDQHIFMQKTAKPTQDAEFPLYKLLGRLNPKLPRGVLNPPNPAKFKTNFELVNAAEKASLTMPEGGLAPEEWSALGAIAMNGSNAELIAPPSRLRQWLSNPESFKEFITQAQTQNPELVRSAVSGLKSLDKVHQLAREGKLPAERVALHMMWGYLSRMLDPFNQEAGWIRLVKDPAIVKHIGESVAGKFTLSKEEWVAAVQKAMAAEAPIPAGRSATANANSFYSMLKAYNGKWQKLADIFNNPKLSGPQIRREFYLQGFGGAGMKHKVFSFVALTLARKDVFIGDRWQVVNLWFPDVQKAAEARGARGGSSEVFSYNKWGTPEDTTGIYGLYGPYLDSPGVAEFYYRIIERNLERLVAQNKDWLTQVFGYEPQASDIHWLTWNIIKNEPVGHSSLDATQQAQELGLYGKPEFAQEFSKLPKQTERYRAVGGAFDVFQQDPSGALTVSQRPAAGGQHPVDR
jgi:hypothetical protein